MTFTPTKEIVSTVLDIELYWRDIKVEGNTLKYPHKNGIYNEEKEINIHEFISKCKDWAYEEGFPIVTCKDWRGYYYSIHRDSFSGTKQTDGTAETELEAVVVACKYIIDNKGHL